MLHDDAQVDLLILGVHLKSEAYPNTMFRLRDLEQSGQFAITEINVPMWTEARQNRRGFARVTHNLTRVLAAHLRVVTKYLLLRKTPQHVYIPYPSVFVLFFLSWLPPWMKSRPKRIVADVFISLYDTIVLDRKLLKQASMAAKLLRWVERRAYAYADKLMIDTEQNARYIARLFNLEDAKMVVAPLSTDERNFKYSSYQCHEGACHVLFIGTLIPLHGVSTILAAIEHLEGRTDIHFKLVGDGQDAPMVRSWSNLHPGRLTWVREWMSSDKLALEIGRADICLGIFGAGDKTQRVCPLKVYAYAAIGRAIITGQTEWLTEATKDLTIKPFAAVRVGDSQALASKIEQLAGDGLTRANLAQASHAFYQARMKNLAANRILTAVLRGDW